MRDASQHHEFHWVSACRNPQGVQGANQVTARTSRGVGSMSEKPLDPHTQDTEEEWSFVQAWSWPQTVSDAVTSLTRQETRHGHGCTPQHSTQNGDTCVHAYSASASTHFFCRFTHIQKSLVHFGGDTMYMCLRKTCFFSSAKRRNPCVQLICFLRLHSQMSLGDDHRVGSREPRAPPDAAEPPSLVEQNRAPGNAQSHTPSVRTKGW